MTDDHPSIIDTARLRRRDPMGDAMRRAAHVFSIPGLGLMVVGFGAWFLASGEGRLPGEAMTAIDGPVIFTDLLPSLGYLGMSAGIIILAALPIARVFLALWIYVKANNPAGAFTALAVLVELVASSQVGKR